MPTFAPMIGQSRGTNERGEHVILVIDDDEDLRSVLVQLLKAAGYQPIAVASGEAALSTLKDGVRPCLVLTDVQLPGMSGLHLRMLIHSDPLLHHIPVLIMSGGPIDVSGSLAEARSRVLRKPVRLEALCDGIERCCAGICAHQRTERISVVH